MKGYMYFIFYVLAGSLLLLIVEKIVLYGRVQRLDYRIHVNGSRGKSSVTRYIAAGLRAQKIKTLAKITGITPSLILSDGRIKTIKRRGAPRVQEQLRLMHYAVRQRYSAFVLECMSIRPEFQKLELQNFNPHIYVLTNILDDHQEVLGKTPEERFSVYGNLLPKKATVITSPGEHSAEIERWVRAKNGHFILPEALDTDIPEGAFKENIALALTVCKQVGVPEEIALPAILQEARSSDRYVFPLGAVSHSGTFINGFAVNDVDSAKNMLAKWQKKFPDKKNTVIIFNSRSDRAIRSRLFTDWFASFSAPFHIILTGDHSPYVRRRLLLKKWPKEQLTVWKRADVAQAKDRLLSEDFKNTLVFGTGNIQGDGLKILEQMEYATEA